MRDQKVVVFSLPLGASAAAALVLMLVGLALEPGGDFLLGLNQNVQQIFGYVAVFVVKERRGLTCTTEPLLARLQTASDINRDLLA